MADGTGIINAPKPWERRDKESAKAFHAFSVYLGMSPNSRSLREVGKKLGKSSTLIERWSSRHEWVKRVKAYDAFLAQEARAHYETERQRQREQRQQVVRMQMGLLMRTMLRHAHDTLTAQELNMLSQATARVLNESRVEYDDLPAQRTLIGGIPDAEPVPISWIRVVPRGAGDSGGDAGNSAGG